MSSATISSSILRSGLVNTHRPTWGIPSPDGANPRHGGSAIPSSNRAGHIVLPWSPLAFNRFRGMSAEHAVNELLFIGNNDILRGPIRMPTSGILWMVERSDIAQNRIRPSTFTGIVPRPDPNETSIPWVPRNEVDLALAQSMGRLIQPHIDEMGAMCGAHLLDRRAWPTNAEVVAHVESHLGYRASDAGVWTLSLESTTHGTYEIKPRDWSAVGSLVLIEGKERLRINELDLDRRALSDAMVRGPIIRGLVAAGFDGVRMTDRHRTDSGAIIAHHSIGILPHAVEQLISWTLRAQHHPMEPSGSPTMSKRLREWLTAL